MPDDVPEIPAHQAKDKAGKIAVHTAHRITRALAESGEPDDGVVVLRTDGPHRSIAGLERLIDSVLEDPAPQDDAQVPGAPEAQSSAASHREEPPR